MPRSTVGISSKLNRFLALCTMKCERMDGLGVYIVRTENDLQLGLLSH
jgi:hypothetical protein